MLQKRYRDIIYLIRQIPNIFQKTIFVFLFWVGWRTLTYFLPRIWGGYLSVMHGAIIAVLGCWILFRGNQTQLSAIGSQAFKCFGLAYVAWGLYDFCWGTLHFLKSDHYETATPLANLIVFIRILASSFTTTAILFSIRDSLKTFFHFRLTLFSLFVSTTVYASMLYIAFFQNNPLWLSLVTVSELGATFVAFLLVFVSIVVLLSTINLEWSVFAAGVLCLLLSDFGSRIERLLSHSVSINVYDSIWYFGMDISLLAILSKTPREKIDSLNFSSLFTSYKSGSLIILILCLFFLACAGNLDLQGLKLIVVLGAFSSFACIFLSSFLTSKIKNFSTLVSSALKEDISFQSSKILNQNTVLPVELKDYYSIVLSSILKEQATQVKQKEIETKMNTLRTVAHNILSPIAALNSKIEEIQSLPEETGLIIKTAINDINDLAHSITQNTMTKSSLQEQSQSIFLIHLIETIITQKRIEFRKRTKVNIEKKFEQNAYALFLGVSKTELRSILSNLINNAYEAIESDGQIKIIISKFEQSARIVIQDNGKGIPAHLIDQIGKKGVTFGKSAGSGIGLYHAKSNIQKWGGSFILRSQEAVGTIIEIDLPAIKPPRWFTPEIHINQGAQVVILDDNPAMHQVWLGKINPKSLSQELQTQIIHCYTVDDFKSKVFLLDINNISLFLIDCALMEDSYAGVELIQNFNITHKSILVTSYFDNPFIQGKCEELGLRLLPKTAVGIIPVQKESQKDSFSKQLSKPICRTCETCNSDCAILIDDNVLVQIHWKKIANQFKILLKAFSSFEEFYDEYYKQINPIVCVNTPIYVDSQLENGISGEMEAKKLYFGLGFRKIYLTTAYYPENFNHLPWIISIIDKTPPWMKSDFKI